MKTLAAAPSTPPWCPDRGDGTYQNPVLFADYSDPDAIRVGEDFWLTSSSFSHVPGLPILYSCDLVNWTLVNHALPQLVPVDHFSQPRHGEGVWAPALRHHAGRFWIYYPDPDFGIYVVTADDPRGAWSRPIMVKAGKGLIDPCPLWDEEGTGYLLHGWAKSRAGICNRLTLHRLAADNLSVTDEGRVVIDGSDFEGWHTIEGPKLHRRDGYYYIFAPAGGVKDGYQAVFRARNLDGPYEKRIVLAQGTTTINGPHQGAWVDTPAGEHWFLHFQEQPAYGRVVHLQPLRWQDDWPVIGTDSDGDGTGEPVLTHRKPLEVRLAPTGPATSDDFEPSLGLQWQWQANPCPEWATLHAENSRLRLACIPRKPPSLWSAPNLLMQKFPAPAFQATTDITLQAHANGDEAGLIVFGYDYAWIGLRRVDEKLELVHVVCHEANQGQLERIVFSAVWEEPRVWLRADVESGARCRFSYSPDGNAFTAVPGIFAAKSSHWVGAKIGIFACTEPHGSMGGNAAFDRFEVAAPS